VCIKILLLYCTHCMFSKSNLLILLPLEEGLNLMWKKVLWYNALFSPKRIQYTNSEKHETISTYLVMLSDLVDHLIMSEYLQLMLYWLETDCFVENLQQKSANLFKTAHMNNILFCDWICENYLFHTFYLQTNKKS